MLTDFQNSFTDRLSKVWLDILLLLVEITSKAIKIFHHTLNASLHYLVEY